MTARLLRILPPTHALFLGVLLLGVLPARAQTASSDEGVSARGTSAQNKSAQSTSAQSASSSGEGREPTGDDAPDLGTGGPVLSETVVVTSTRIERETERLSANPTVITQRLERTAALTMDDTLRQVPAFSLFRRASSLVAHPTSQGASLRGVGPSGVSRALVLLDGVPLNDTFGGWVYWSRIPRLEVVKAEVVPGGGSNVWGNYALGGVIQLFTEPGSGSRVSLLAEGGEWSTVGAEALAGIEVGGVDLQISGDYFDTDGYYVLPPDERGPIDVPAWSSHDAAGFRGRAGLGTGLSIDGRYEFFEEERGNGTPLTGNDTSLNAFRLSLDGSSGRSSWSARVFGDDQDFASTFSSQEDDRSSESPALDQYLVGSEALSIGGLWARPLGGSETREARHTLSAGGEWRVLEGSTNESFFWSGTEFLRGRAAGGDQELGGVWLQDEIARGRYNIQIGARVDRWSASDGYLQERELSDGSVRQDVAYPDRSETTVSPKLGLAYQLASAQSVYGSVYQSFRAPTINELYRPFRVRNDITAANALLEPEILQGLEAGWRLTGKRTQVRTAAFANRLDEAVANVTVGFGPGVVPPCGFVPAGGTCRQRDNLDRVQIVGLEADVQHELGSFDLGLAYQFSDTEVKKATVSPELEGKALVQVPENQVTARLGYTGKIDGSFQVRWVDDQFDDDLNERVLSSFFVADLWLGYALSSGLSLHLGVQNLLDEEIQVALTADGLLTIGMPRMFYGGLRWSWGGSGR